MENKKSKKPLMLVLSSVLICAIVVGGTLAYLTWSDSKTNTFTVGNIAATLSEPNWDGFSDHKLVPGTTVLKDPTVTIKENSESCYVFMAVKNNLMVGNNTIGKVEIGKNWEEIADTTPSLGYDLYIYKNGNNYVVPSSTSATNLPALFNEVSVSSEATQSQLEQITSSAQNDTIKVAAFVHQSEGVEKEAAQAVAIVHFNGATGWF